MVIKDKKVKHKEDVRLRILEVAKALFLKNGYEETSIRKIALEIGYSPTTIYLYYKDKSDIIYTLHQEGFKLLRSQFMVLQYVGNAFERLKAMGRVYIKFALENPDYYDLMFILEEPLNYVNKNCNVEWEEGEAAFAVLLNTVAECKKIGYFTHLDVNSMALLIWSTIHGLCSLKLRGHLDHVASIHLSVAENSTVLDEAFECFVMVLERLK